MNRRQFFNGTLAAAATAVPGQYALASLLQSLTTVSSSIAAVTGDGNEVELEKAAIKELQESLRGNLLLNGGASYDEARRVLNPSIDKHPALIVQPSGPADVANAVTFANERNLLLAVKCGGHSVAGRSTCDGGMQIDLSRFRNTRIDRASKTAYVTGGSLLGDLDHESMAQGLVTTAGTVSHTGIGGLSLGGGFGRLARKYGLTLDNIKAVDIVTADGQLRHASAEENEDLFWGVRGGGGNFGIVTSFELALHEMDRTVIGGDVIVPLDRGKELLQFYADYSASAPDELSVDFIMVAPPGGQPGVALIHTVYSGDPRKADKVLAPLNGIANPIANTIGAIDYVALQRKSDNSDPRHGGDYLKSGFVTEIDDRQIDAVVQGFDNHPDRSTVFYYQQSGGAIGRVADDATAFAHRYSTNGPMAIASWNANVDPEPHIAYLRSYWNTITPFTHGFYTNVVEDATQQATNRNFRGNYDRLVALKTQYDPGNLFRLNANVEPAAV